MFLTRLFSLSAIVGLALTLTTSCGDEDAVCSPSSVRDCSCAAGGTGTQSCNASGTAWAECVCETSCTPEQKRCMTDRNAVEICNAAGNAYELLKSCKANETCQGGACVPNTCGNSNCEADESCEICPADCGTCCGNGICDTALGETLESCPQDCTAPPAHQWAFTIGGANTDVGQAVAVDGGGNIIVVGTFRDALPLDESTTLLPNGSEANAFVAKYSATRELLWARPLTSAGPSEIADVATDASGNIYLTGIFVGQAAFGGSGVIFTATNNEYPHLWVAKFTTDGTLDWSDTVGGVGELRPYNIAVDANGNVALGGEVTGSITYGGAVLPVPGPRSAFVARYDAAGVLSWARGVDGADATTEARDGLVAIGSSGDVYFAGTYGPGNLVIGDSTLISTNRNAFLVKLTAATGAPVWAKSLAGVGNTSASELAIARALTVQGDDPVLVGHFLAQRLELGATVLRSTSQHDGFVAGYSAAGAPEWGVSIAASLRVDLLDVTPGSAGDLFVAGLAEGYVKLASVDTTTAGRAILAARIDDQHQVVFVELADGPGLEYATSIAATASKLYLTGTLTSACTFGDETITPTGSSDAFLWHLALP